MKVIAHVNDFKSDKQLKSFADLKARLLKTQTHEGKPVLVFDEMQEVTPNSNQWVRTQILYTN